MCGEEEQQRGSRGGGHGCTAAAPRVTLRDECAACLLLPTTLGLRLRCQAPRAPSAWRESTRVRQARVHALAPHARRASTGPPGPLHHLPRRAPCASRASTQVRQVRRECACGAAPLFPRAPQHVFDVHAYACVCMCRGRQWHPAARMRACMMQREQQGSPRARAGQGRVCMHTCVQMCELL